MRILLIVDEFGISAPGLVAQKVAIGLSRVPNVELDIITTDAPKALDSGINRVIIRRKKRNARLDKLSFYLLGCDFFSSLWAKRTVRVIKSQYDCVLSVVSMFHYSSLLLGELLEKKGLSHSVFLAYFVDAVPAPRQYLQDSLLRFRLGRFIRSHSGFLSAIFSTCEEMAAYQKAFLEDSIIVEELFNPTVFSSLYTYSFDSASDPVFLYTGGIYKPRNPIYLLKAFKRILLEYPSAKLIFVGTTINLEQMGIFPTQGSIQVLPYQSDLSSLYSRSWALIDIGSDVEEDIYLSSKITGYISINRPIICETSKQSPAMRVFARLESVYLCVHSSNELYTAMKSVIVRKNDYDYKERDSIIEKMSDNHAANVILRAYNRFNTRIV